LDRSVLAGVIQGNPGHRLLEDKDDLPAKMHLPGSLARVGQPRGSANSLVGPLATSFPWYTDRWALVMIWWDSLGVESIWCDFVHSLCVLFMFSPSFRSWVPACHNSPKLVELVRIAKFYDYFNIERCRS
jgi:hypothetical protein